MNTRGDAIDAIGKALTALWVVREVLNRDFTTSDEDYATVKRIIRETAALRRNLVMGRPHE